MNEVNSGGAGHVLEAGSRGCNGFLQRNGRRCPRRTDGAERDCSGGEAHGDCRGVLGAEVHQSDSLALCGTAPYFGGAACAGTAFVAFKSGSETCSWMGWRSLLSSECVRT